MTPEELIVLLVNNGFEPDPREAKCKDCSFRQNVPGSVHSACGFPKGTVEPRLYFAEITLNTPGGKLPAISFNPHGIEHGWVIWPLNFDPVWLRWCFFYKAKEEPKQNE